jgi:hypothetical protein
VSKRLDDLKLSACIGSSAGSGPGQALIRGRNNSFDTVLAATKYHKNYLTILLLP